MSNKEDSIIKNYLEKVKLIEKYNKCYYDKDAPVISDSKYDELKKKTLELEKKYLFLKKFESINNKIYQASDYYQDFSSFFNNLTS